MTKAAQVDQTPSVKIKKGHNNKESHSDFDKGGSPTKAGVKTAPIVHVGPYPIGGNFFSVIAGPCAIESKEQFHTIAQFVKKEGAMALRGGMFKLRTSPHTFQGLGREAFDIAREVKSKVQLPFISEVTDPRQIDDMMDFVDVFQVGSRNMHNYELLKELGATHKPVLLKRSFSALIDEWIFAAEYIALHGNKNVILCERGIRSFETKTRNTFDLNAVAYLKQNTHFPVLADPSHGTGRRELVIPMSLAAIAAGADGIMVEVHNQPDKAKSDGHQSLHFEEFRNLMESSAKILKALNTKKQFSCLR